MVMFNSFGLVCGMAVTAGLIVALRGTIPVASAGLALAYANQLSGIMQYIVRLACETESRFTSVQRMHTYLMVSFCASAREFCTLNISA